MQFTIEEKLYESNFTSVYRAFDTVLQRRILLKVLHKHHIADTDISKRFIREAQACAALHSEYIVQVYGLVEYEDSPAIVMEFVEGKSLKTIIAEQKMQSMQYVERVALHVLRGLVVAHEKGIIHRDIKPGNILAAENGMFKVTDFGLAYMSFIPTMTAQGLILGTPAYMSPEQIRQEEIDQRSDLFSLGVTLIEVLTCTRIFDGSSYAECAKKILAFNIDMLNQFISQSSVEFVQFLKLLMEPKREERFNNSKDALDSLEKRNAGTSVASDSTIPHQNKLRLFFAISISIFVLLVIVWLIFYQFINVKMREVKVEQRTPDTTVTMNILNKNLEKTNIPASGKNTISPLLQNSHTPINPSPPATGIPSSDSGTALLTSNPWAKVYIDNKFIGETPIGNPIKLSVGSHSVMFMHPSFEPILQTITIQAERETYVNGNFIENAGYLNCLATPWAEVYVDEQYKNTTPFEKPIMLSPGNHIVRCKNSLYADIIRDVTIKTRDTIVLNIYFKEKR